MCTTLLVPHCSTIRIILYHTVPIVPYYYARPTIDSEQAHYSENNLETETMWIVDMGTFCRAELPLRMYILSCRPILIIMLSSLDYVAVRYSSLIVLCRQLPALFEHIDII